VSAEAAASAELARERHLVRLWRPPVAPGERKAVGLYRADSEAPMWSTETARFAREHDDAQVVGVGARMHGAAGATQVVDAFVAPPLSSGERYARRIRLISNLEATGDAPPISAG
jgi:ribose 5-phosphate isomerase B